jgi:hypothetical protein
MEKQNYSDSDYDYVIVGGGPTGLTLALYLSKYHQKVAVVERESSLGGCHSVKRVNGLFTEHGPRVYLENYLTFQRMLQQELHTSFEELFTPYQYGNGDVMWTLLQRLSFREIVSLATAFLSLNDSDKERTLEDFVRQQAFSSEAQDILDRIGRLTDGGGIGQYTLFSFLQIINQNLLYPGIYEPRKPNDVGLFALWQTELQKRGVAVYLDTEVTEIHVNSRKGIVGEDRGWGHHLAQPPDTVEWIGLKGASPLEASRRLSGKRFIFAMPPAQIVPIFQKNHLKTGFHEDFDQWAMDTNYIPYIPVVFHWNHRFPIKKAWGYPQTSWGVGYIVMSDYTDFHDPRSKTVISSLVSMVNRPSEYLGKTANQISNPAVIIQEVFRQLKSVLGEDLPPYDEAILSQNTYDGEKWVPLHTAFMTTTHGHLPFESRVFDNVFNCGVQNGKSDYVFTSMESSVVNAIELVYLLVPESKKEIEIRRPVTFRWMLFILLLLFFLSLMVLFFRWWWWWKSRGGFIRSILHVGKRRR